MAPSCSRKAIPMKSISLMLVLGVCFCCACSSDGEAQGGADAGDDRGNSDVGGADGDARIGADADGGVDVRPDAAADGDSGGPADADAEPDAESLDWMSYWIALDGSDDKDCRTRQTACRHWSTVLGRASASMGAVPVDIIFACGIYPAADEGPFSNASARVSLAGTANAPVRIRSETLHCATLQGNGGKVLALDRYDDVSPQHVIVDSLRVTQIDRQGSDSSPHTVSVYFGDYITIRNCEVVKNNRYYNSQPIMAAFSDHVRIEHNRVYGSHRHLITFYKGPHRCVGGTRVGELCDPDESFCTDSTCAIVPSDGVIESVVTMNYVNSCVGGPAEAPDCSGYSADLNDGYPSHHPLLADECVSVYNANDVAVINNLLENCEHLGANHGFGGGDGSLWANNVIYKYIYGFLTTANTHTGDTRTPDNTGENSRFFNNVGIAGINHGGVLRDGMGTMFENNTLIRSNDTDVPGRADYDPAPNSETKYGIQVSPPRPELDDPCVAPALSITFLRNFVAGTSPDARWSNAFDLSDSCTITGEYNAYCEVLGNCGTGAIYTNRGNVTTLKWDDDQRRLDPGVLTQYVYIPDGDPRSTAANGQPIGADIRCVVNEKGERTSQPFWDPATGPFADNPQRIVTRLLNGAPPPDCR
jgi:hypothetical protein